jgi:hypothetical protein
VLAMTPQGRLRMAASGPPQARDHCATRRPATRRRRVAARPNSR